GCGIRSTAAIAAAAARHRRRRAELSLVRRIIALRTSMTRTSGGFPLRRGDFFECWHDHAGHGVDPHKVIFDGLDPGNTFCGYMDRSAMPLIEQRARKVHNSVAHHDVDEADWSPRL